MVAGLRALIGTMFDLLSVCRIELRHRLSSMLHMICHARSFTHLIGIEISDGEC